MHFCAEISELVLNDLALLPEATLKLCCDTKTRLYVALGVASSELALKYLCMALHGIM